MNKIIFITLVIIAHLFLFLSFRTELPFWTIFSISFFILSVLAIRFGKFDKENSSFKSFSIGIISGIFLYMIFFIGKHFSNILFPDLLQDVSDLYSNIKPSIWWEYIVLFVIIIPGEELFWRGYIQKNLVIFYDQKMLKILFAAVLYASANIYTGNFLFLLATLAGGILWGILYEWKRNIYINILSHLVFDLLLLVVFPIF